jgi:hypothetical protein
LHQEYVRYSPALGSELALKNGRLIEHRLIQPFLDFILANTSAVFDQRIEIRSEIARCKGIGTNFSIGESPLPMQEVRHLAPTHFRVP